MTGPLEQQGRPLPRVGIVRGTPDDDELAALAAAIPAAYRQEADEATAPEPRANAWALSRRLRRSPNGRSPWGRFAG